jgi:hypothetical protein
MEESASASQPHCIANDWRLERIEFTRQQSHHPAEEQNTLPLTTSISNLLLRLLTRHQHPEPGIAYKLARYVDCSPFGLNHPTQNACKLLMTCFYVYLVISHY